MLISIQTLLIGVISFPPTIRSVAPIFAVFPTCEVPALVQCFAIYFVTYFLLRKAWGKRWGLAVGARILGDIAKGEDAKESIGTHSREGLSNLLSKASDKLRRQSGSGRRRRRRRRIRRPMIGQGRRRRRRKQKGGGTRVHTYRVSLPKRRKRRAHQSISSLFDGRSVSGAKRRRRVDSLGLL